MKNDTRLYILMRNDLSSMSSGRAMAQASHASNSFIENYGHREEVQKWQKQTNQGFGTAIVLAASKHDIKDIGHKLKMKKFIFKEVIDPEYGIKVDIEAFNLIDTQRIQPLKTIFTEDLLSAIVFKTELTCAYTFGTKEELNPYLGHLQLHP